MTAALEGGEWSAARPGRTLPPGKTRYPFYRRLGGPQGRSGRAENLVPTGIRSRTVQPVVSRYTGWATRPTKYSSRALIFLKKLTVIFDISANTSNLSTSTKNLFLYLLLLRTIDLPVAENSTCTVHKFTRNRYPCPGEIRTRKPKKGETAEPHLRPRGHRDR